MKTKNIFRGNFVVTAIIALLLLWSFNRYVVMPGCMRFSKPVTMYMEWNEKQIEQGTPKRATFRIPSAYFMSPAPTRENYWGGKVDFISFAFNSEGGPACLIGKGLEPWEIKRIPDRKVPVFIQPGTYKIPEPMQYSICTRHPKLNSDVKGFSAYKTPSGICYMPDTNTDPAVFFDCMVTDTPRGCQAWTNYKGMRVKYILNHSDLGNWKNIHDKVVEKLNAYLINLDE